jgi:hypothetical protein
MPEPSKFKVGQRVKLVTQAGRVGKIAEYRGPLGPKGAKLYRVMIRQKPRPGYVEVVEANMEPVAAGS